MTRQLIHDHAPLPFEKREVGTWPDLRREIDGLLDKGTEASEARFYRGQSDADWCLTPSIERGFWKKNYRESELESLKEFRSKAHLYQTALPAAEDALSWIAMMRHHGLSTRLMDWTYSPLVALYFAMSPRGHVGMRALWALHRYDLMQGSAKTCQEVWGTDSYAVQMQLVESGGHIAHYFSSQRFAHDQGQQTVTKGVVIPVLPKHYSSRLSLQSGIFLVNLNYAKPFCDSLFDCVQPASLLKLSFPSSLRSDALKYLMTCNVHAASLFGDLDGLAEFVDLMYELYPDRG